MPRRNDIESILIIGSGPIVILSLIHISEPTRPERIGVGGVGV